MQGLRQLFAVRGAGVHATPRELGLIHVAQ